MNATTTTRRRLDASHASPEVSWTALPRLVPPRPPGTPLAYSANIEGYWDTLDTIAMARFCDGSEPFAAQADLTGVAAIADIAPAAAPTMSIVNEHADRWLITGDGWTFFAIHRTGGGVHVTISAATMASRDDLMATVRARVPAPPDDDSVPVTFWFMEQRPRQVERRIAAPVWTEIRRNYPAGIQPRIERTMGLVRPGGTGRLLLWHGPPGTGKTTAARALTRAWSTWCRTTIVTEPERLFASTGLIFDLLESDDDEHAPSQTGDDETRWTLLIVEDADELLRADARSASGQALSRLLNMADGFMGQGMEVLILLSTNERLGGLHPAVSRPGRCLSEIEFPRFRRAEASEWLGRDPGGVAVDVSLAELVQLRDGEADAPAAADASADGVGQYL